jgi:DNA-directed RNA polymerase specialized sigma24 family protein
VSAWTPGFDREARALVQRVIDGDRAAWRELMVRIAPRIEGWARGSRVLRRCRLAGDDDVRAVMVSVLERLAANDHANLRKFVARADLPAAPDDLVTAVMKLGRLDDDALDEDGAAAAGDDDRDTPLRGWLLRLVDFTARDHVRDRHGWAAGDGGPSKRDLHTDARPLADQPEAAARPPMTDRLTVSRLVDEIQAHIRTFPPQMRDAILLWLDEVSPEDIAARLALADPARAKALVRAGQARLRERFRGRSPLVFAS